MSLRFLLTKFELHCHVTNTRGQTVSTPGKKRFLVINLELRCYSTNTRGQTCKSEKKMVHARRRRMDDNTPRFVSRRNKLITELLDMKVKKNNSKAEVNLSRLITEFSRSRSDRELRELVFEYVRESVDEGPELTESEWSNEFEFFTWQWACLPYAERREELQYKVTELEYRRLNGVIKLYLEDQLGFGNRYAEQDWPEGF